MPNPGDCLGRRNTRASKRNPMGMYNRLRGQGDWLKVKFKKIKFRSVSKKYIYQFFDQANEWQTL
jgi:hypothetical protein